MQNNENHAFRDLYRTVDLLLVDDIQFIAGKQATEEEFFHTFNHLREAGKQIVVTTTSRPGDRQARAAACSRFEGGLLADIQRPDFERASLSSARSPIRHLRIGTISSR
jgi:chromosomal replication initiator protein